MYIYIYIYIYVIYIYIYIRYVYIYICIYTCSYLWSGISLRQRTAARVPGSCSRGHDDEQADGSSVDLTDSSAGLPGKTNTLNTNEQLKKQYDNNNNNRQYKQNQTNTNKQ